jgi:hypothetical protein
MKQDSEIVSIDDGMQTDSSDQHCPNAQSPTVLAFKPDSNLKARRVSHRWKHDSEIVSIDEGMKIH